jgi:hypothetical protein
LGLTPERKPQLPAADGTTAFVPCSGNGIPQTQTMKRADICASDDHDSIARLLAAIQAVGGELDGEYDALGVGLHRFRTPGGDLSVFADAWLVDVGGPEELVDRVLAILSGADYR